MASVTERAWMAQWRQAASALADQRARELATLTHADALAASDAVLQLAALTPPSPDRLATSGLVAQQALLHGRRSP